MRKVKASSLVLDFELYPRNNIDSHNVSQLVDALTAGVELPPVIADKTSHRVVDGFHRVKAHLRTFGPRTTMTVIEKPYRNEREMFLDSMRYNAKHGAQLDPCDRTRCLIIADRLKIPMTSVAGALLTTTDRLGQLMATRTAIHGNLAVPIKRTIEKFAGHKLTNRQQETNLRSSGMNQVFYINQLIDLIEANMLDTDNAPLMNRLKVLSKLLINVLRSQ